MTLRPVFPMFLVIGAVLIGCGASTKDGSTGDAGGGTNAGGAATTGGSGGITGGAGSRNTGGGGSRTTGGAGSGTTGGAGAGGNVGATAVCPSSAPSAGSSCAGTQNCTWGDSAQPACRIRGSCAAGAWNIIAPPAYCSTLGAACPGAPPNGSCPDIALTCLYPNDVLCGCAACNCNPPFLPGPPCLSCEGQALGTVVWRCNNPPSFAAPCPALQPNVGAACEVPADVGCPPAACGSSQGLMCSNGSWQWITQGVPCPVCASPDTPIATPQGERPIADLRVGDLVYSVDGQAIRAVVIERVSRTRVTQHRVVRVAFADGRTLEISALHPTADGRVFGELARGGSLDGHVIGSVELVPYLYEYTYDILPASDSGSYFAAGMQIGSTLGLGQGPRSP